MATRQQLTDAIDNVILNVLGANIKAPIAEFEKLSNAISALVYARSDLIRTDYEVTKLEQMKGRIA